MIMLIWDPDLPIPFDDLFEVQEPPTEVLAVQQQSRGQYVSKDPTIAQTSGGNPMPDLPRSPFVSRRNPC
jgi:hypothetical protein